MKISSNLRNVPAAALFEKCCTIFDNHSPLAENSYLKPRFVSANAKTKSLSDAIKCAKGTISLDEADAKLDTELKKLFSALYGYRDLPFPDKNEAAEFFLEILTRHGGKSILSKPYEEENALVTSIETEFSSDKAKAFLKLLEGVDVLSANVFEANKAVKALSVEKTKLSAAQSAEVNATAIKKELIAFFNGEILPYLDLMKNTEPDTYKAFAAEISEAVDKANDSIPRKTKKSKA